MTVTVERASIQWPSRWSQCQLKVLIYLAEQPADWRSFAQRLVAERTGMSKETVWRLRVQLEELGLIRVISPPDGAPRRERTACTAKVTAKGLLTVLRSPARVLHESCCVPVVDTFRPSWEVLKSLVLDKSTRHDSWSRQQLPELDSPMWRECAYGLTGLLVACRLDRYQQAQLVGPDDVAGWLEVSRKQGYEQLRRWASLDGHFCDRDGAQYRLWRPSEWGSNAEWTAGHKATRAAKEATTRHEAERENYARQVETNFEEYWVAAHHQDPEQYEQGAAVMRQYLDSPTPHTSLWTW